MDLVFYEDVPLSDLQDQALGRAANNLRDVQEQAAAWLRKAVLTVVPGLAARGIITGDRHD